MATEEKTLVFDSKKMLEENGKKETKVRYTDRMAVEIIAKTEFYNVGDIIYPHKVKAEALISQKIGKKYTPKEEE